MVEFPKPFFRIAIGLVEQGGKVLLSQRKAGTHLAGLWEFPGGKIHEGESGEQAVLREIREELGIGVRVERFYAHIQHEYPERRVELLVYLCTLTEGKPSPLQGAACVWADLPDLKKYAFPEANALLIKRLTEQGLK